MSKLFKNFFVFISFFFLLATPLMAQTKSPSLKVLPTQETIDGDYFAAGEIVEILGTVNGDLYAAGGQVIVEGTVTGDVLVAGGQITLSGDIGQDARIAGGQITVSGDIGRNLTIAAGNVDILDNATLGGSLVLGAGNVRVSTNVPGNITAGTGRLAITNSVGGNIEAGVGELYLGPSAQIAGDIIYYSDSEADIQEGATVSGQVQKRPLPFQTPTEEETRRGFRDAFVAARTFTAIMSFISLLIIGLLCLRFFPNYIQKTQSTLTSKPWATLGIGFLALIVTPILFFILLVTVLGVPLGLILIVTYLITLYLTPIPIALWLGKSMLQRETKTSDYWAFVLGLLLYSLISLLPVIGWFARFFTTLFGLGTYILAKKDTYNLARDKKIY